MHRLVVLALLAGCHTYVRDDRPRNVSCRVALREQTIAAGKPLHATVTLSNQGPSVLYVGRTVDTFNSDWVIDGRGRAKRDTPLDAAIDAAMAAGSGVTGSGPSGDRFYVRADFIEVRPRKSWSTEIEVGASLEGTTWTINGVEMSDRLLAQQQLAVPGTHQLQLIIRSYPTDAVSEPEFDYDWPPWEAVCNLVRVAVSAGP